MTSSNVKDAQCIDATVQHRVLRLAVVPRSGFDNSAHIVEFPLYWVMVPNSCDLNDTSLEVTLSDVLCDSLLQQLLISTQSTQANWISSWQKQGYNFLAERQFLPGVTDNLGKTVEEALQLSGLPSTIKVASGTGLLIKKSTQLNSIKTIGQHCQYRYYHPITDKFLVHDLTSSAGSIFLDFPEVHLPEAGPCKTIALDLDDAQLQNLSRSRILALSLAEMQTIAKYFSQDSVKQLRKSHDLPIWPTDVELEIIAQTWSEHCKHKIFNATIQYHDDQGSQTIKSLYKTYIQAPTIKLKNKRKDLLSVFEDNSGVVEWDHDWAVCFKVETHNSPSALEPYGGALTGILGVNRDIMGTGLGAKPIFNTDVFCFAYPSKTLPQGTGMLPAEVIIQGVRKGVQDGGNKSGIPTVNGALYFHPGYRAKPLVYCGTGGILPKHINGISGIEKATKVGDAIVMAGGRVGKDGIHGATFSSEALHQGSPVSAVQIGDPFTQKRLSDFVIEARDAGLITGITDNGAGGLSSSVGEMAQLTGGATMELDNIPLKYPGLADYEIVVSESQERMTISTKNFGELLKIAEKHHVEITQIGDFNNQGYFEIVRHGKLVALLDLDFLHHGLPELILSAKNKQQKISGLVKLVPEDLSAILLSLLSNPNICSKEEIIRQYDHEVQGTSVIKPLMGPDQQAPCDAAVLKPLPNQSQGLVISNGLCPQLSQYDCYLMAICATDEAIRNAVCVGADPKSLSLLDNFCWPDPVASSTNADGEHKLFQLVRACQGLHDAVLAFEAPLISGKDSMKNDFDDGNIRISIPPTLLVSAMGKMSNIEQAVTMEFKTSGDLIYLLAAGNIGLTGSLYADLQNWDSDLLPSLDLAQAPLMYQRLHDAIKKGLAKSCHDLSEGGLAVAISECVIGSKLGAQLSMHDIIQSAAPTENSIDTDLYSRLDVALFGEGPGRILVTVDPNNRLAWEEHFDGLHSIYLGIVSDKAEFKINNAQEQSLLSLDHSSLLKAWSSPLPLDGSIIYHE